MPTENLLHQDTSRLLKKAMIIIDSIRGVSIPEGQEWLNDGQILAIKTCRHIESIITLSNGVETDLGHSKCGLYVDHSSIATLGRAAFESYVNFHYIFGRAPSQTARFRHHIWRMSGLLERQGLHGFETKTDEQLHILSSEKMQIEKLRAAITAFPEFQALSSDLRKSVKRGKNLRMGTDWLTLAEGAGIPRKYAHDMYSHFCEYSHSGALSALQIRDASNDGSGYDLAGATISFCAVLLTQLIRNYVQIFPTANLAFSKDEEACNLVERWVHLTERLEDMFGPVTT